MKKDGLTVLRWIAVPFAAILAAFIINLIGVVYTWINGNGIEFYTGGTSSIGLTTIILFLLQNFAVGFSFVWFGAYVAPSNQKNVAIILSTVQVCICVGSAILMLLGFATSSLQIWAAIIAAAIGGISAAVKYTPKTTHEIEINNQ